MTAEEYEPTSEEVLKGEMGDSPFIHRDEATDEKTVSSIFKFPTGGELPLDHFSQAAYLARTFGGETIFPHSEQPEPPLNGHKHVKKLITLVTFVRKHKAA